LGEDGGDLTEVGLGRGILGGALLVRQRDARDGVVLEEAVGECSRHLKPEEVGAPKELRGFLLWADWVCKEMSGWWVRIGWGGAGWRRERTDGIGRRLGTSAVGAGSQWGR
jgi:hypothetical protein